MNRVVGIGVGVLEKKTKHTMEIEVEFDEPCTQFEAQQMVLETLGDLLYDLKEGGKDD